MKTLVIKSTGRIETTTLHLNGEQIAGVRELFVDLKEDGTFDAWLTYDGSDGSALSKRLFLEYLEKLKVVDLPADEIPPPSPLQTRSLVIESNGEIEDTTVAFDGEMLDGLVELFVYIRKAQGKGVLNWRRQGEHDEFIADANFRNADGTLDKQSLF